VVSITEKNIGKGNWQTKIMKDVTNYISKEDAEKLINVTENLRDRLLFTWLFRSGRRVSEIVRSVCVKDVDFQNKTIVYNILKKKKRKDKYGIPIDEKHKAILPIDDHTLSLIGKWIKFDKLGVEHWVIDISRQRVDQLIRYYSKKAGVGEKHTHQLRHGFAIHGVKSGVDIRTIQKMMQHSDLSTTAFYLQFSTEDLREASKKMWD